MADLSDVKAEMAEQDWFDDFIVAWSHVGGGDEVVCIKPTMGKADEELHIHHIEKLVHHETTDEAHRPGNLITLCEPCHRELEREPKYLKTTLL